MFDNNIYSLTEQQQVLLIEYELEPMSSKHNTYRLYEIIGELDAAKFLRFLY